MKTPVALLTSVLLFASCAQQESDVDATNKVGDKTVHYWYETFTLDSFAQFHKDNKETLLGNQISILPESLKGLWFMDGNPVSDQSLSMSSVVEKNTEEVDFTFPVNTPMTFSWAAIADSHRMIGLIDTVKLQYNFKFHDCPEDVVVERAKLIEETPDSEMTDPGCTREDKEFAIITPMIEIGKKQIRLPQGLAYFDMYLMPRGNADYYVWERRSKVFGVLSNVKNFVDNILNKVFRKVKEDTEEDQWHRYKFTQILDGEGNKLSTYDQSFSPYVANLVSETGENQSEDILFYLCYQGVEGCSSEAQNSTAAVPTVESEAQGFEIAKILAL